MKEQPIDAGNEDAARDEMAENKEKLIRNFYIECAGDPSVGIFPSSWELIGDTYFEPDDLEEFRTKLECLFEEYITGEPTKVTTFEERIDEFKEDE